MHIEYPWDKFLKVNTILCDFWYILLHHSAKLLGQFINAMAVHLFPCIFINIGHYHGGKSVQQNRVYHCCLNLHFFDRSCKCKWRTWFQAVNGEGRERWGPVTVTASPGKGHPSEAVTLLAAGRGQGCPGEDGGTGQGVKHSPGPREPGKGRGGWLGRHSGAWRGVLTARGAPLVWAGELL